MGQEDEEEHGDNLEREWQMAMHAKQLTLEVNGHAVLVPVYGEDVGTFN